MRAVCVRVVRESGAFEIRSESGVCESSGRSVNSGCRSMRSVVIAWVLMYETVKQQLLLSGGLPPLVRMGHSKACL